MNAFSQASTAPGPPVSTSPANPSAPTMAPGASTSGAGTSADVKAAVPELSSGSTSTSASVPAEPKPVTPASQQAPPKVALDKVASEPNFLEKALGAAQPYIAKVESVTQPYVDKVQQTTKPYTDAALNKAKELVDKIEGQGPAVAGTPTAAAAAGGSGATTIGEKNLGPETVSTSAASSTTAGTGGFEEKFENTVNSIGRRISNFGQVIDEKTSSGSSPGLVTKMMGVVGNLTEKADSFIQGHAPHTTNVTSTVGHPVTTTTNSVPHTDRLDVVPTGSSAAGPTTSVLSGPTPTATAGASGAVVPP